MLRVYADESETEATAICGFIATPDYWKSFSKKWQDKLDDFNAPYFHFREFTTKELYTTPGNAYYGWSDSKRDKFLLDLAELAGEQAIPVGGYYAPNVAEKQLPKERWEKSVIKVFEDLNHVLSDVWPNYTGGIFFVFDDGGIEEKRLAIRKVHAAFADNDARFGGLAFEDDKDPMHLPLQAADMCSYIGRQFVEKLQEANGIIKNPEIRILDLLLLRNRNTELRKLSANQWKLFVERLRHHRKDKVAEWKRKGIKQVWYPHQHFPWHIYGGKVRGENPV